MKTAAITAILVLANVALNGCRDFDLDISPNNRDLVISLNSDGIYFPLNTSKDVEIYLYDIQNEDLTQLTNNNVFDGSANFSPDGNSIVYISGDPTENEFGNKIRVMCLESREYKTIAIGGHPQWSPKTDMIAYLTEIPSAKNNDKETEVSRSSVLVNMPTMKNYNKGIELDWSSVLARIQSAMNDDKETKVSWLSVTDKEGKENSLFFKGSPPVYCWDPNGKSIFYIVPGGSEIQLNSVDVISRKVHRLLALDNKYGEIGRIICSSDGRFIALNTLKPKERRKLAVVDLKQKKVQTIVEPPKESFATFSPKSNLCVTNYTDNVIEQYHHEDGQWAKKESVNFGKKNRVTVVDWIMRGSEETMICVESGGYGLGVVATDLKMTTDYVLVPHDGLFPQKQNLFPRLDPNMEERLRQEIKEGLIEDLFK